MAPPTVVVNAIFVLFLLSSRNSIALDKAVLSPNPTMARTVVVVYLPLLLIVITISYSSFTLTNLFPAALGYHPIQRRLQLSSISLSSSSSPSATSVSLPLTKFLLRWAAIIQSNYGCHCRRSRPPKPHLHQRQHSITIPVRSGSGRYRLILIALRQTHACSNSNASTAKPMAFALSHTSALTVGTISPKIDRRSATLSFFKSKLKKFFFSE